MKNNQLDSQSNETSEKSKFRQDAKTPAGDKNKEQKSKTTRQGGKSGTVLGEINDDPKKKKK